MGPGDVVRFLEHVAKAEKDPLPAEGHEALTFRRTFATHEVSPRGTFGAGVVTGGYVSGREAREFSERRSGSERDQVGSDRTPNALWRTRECRRVSGLDVYPYAAYGYTKTPGGRSPGVSW
jgi:hypothetical protein